MLEMMPQSTSPQAGRLARWWLMPPCLILLAACTCQLAETVHPHKTTNGVPPRTPTHALKEEATMSLDTPAAKRTTPEEVPPVQAGSLRLEAPHNTSHRGQTGGFVIARDAGSGAELWSVQVYRTIYNDDLESDVQDVFIDSLHLDEDGRHLSIRDELGRHYRLDITTRRVTPQP